MTRTPALDTGSTGPLLAAYDGPIATLTLNRPERFNALNAQVVDELGAAVTALSVDPTIRVIILTGSGRKAFSAGADLDELVGISAARAYEVLSAGQRSFRALQTCGKPVVAAVNGLALGGGLELALACTFIVAAENAAFALPENGLGLIPGYGGTQRLPRLIGRQVATYLMLTGDRMTAERAYACGLLPLPPISPDDLLREAHAIADRLAQRSPTATAAILRAVDHGTDRDLDGALAYESALAALAVCSPDAAEGIDAFRGKRAPHFGVTL